MKVYEMFPNKYANGEDLNGKPATLTVEKVQAEEMRPAQGAAPVKKWVLYFQGAQKGVILNRTITNQIAAALGDDTDGWTGKKITIYPVPMAVAGVQRVAIRARPANGNGRNGGEG